VRESDLSFPNAEARNR